MTYPTYAQLMQTYGALKDMLELRETEVQFKQGIIDESLAYIAELEIALRDIANGSYTAEGCEEVARSVLEKKP